MLLDAYASMKQHESNLPEIRNRLVQALQGLTQLYDGWNNKDKADEWRKKLAEQHKQ